MKKILLCLFAFTLVSCDIEEEIINQLFPGTVTADINGQTTTFRFGPNSVGAAFASSEEGAVVAYAFAMEASSDGNSNVEETTRIIINLVMDGPDQIVSGAVFNYPTDVLNGSYTFDDASGSNLIDADETISASLSITNVDSANSRISGTFSFIVLDETTTISHTVSNGSFTDIPFLSN